MCLPWTRARGRERSSPHLQVPTTRPNQRPSTVNRFAIANNGRKRPPKQSSGCRGRSYENTPSFVVCLTVRWSSLVGGGWSVGCSQNLLTSLNADLLEEYPQVKTASTHSRSETV